MAQAVSAGFGVYVSLKPGEVISAGEVIEETSRWIDEHAAEPLRSAIRAFLGQGTMTIDLVPSGQLSLPPLDLLSYMGMGELEERRLRSASHVVVVAAHEKNLHPRVGLFTVLAAARTMAHRREGVIFQPEVPRVLAIASHTRDLPGDARIAVAEHIVVPFSIGEHGLGWMTSKGMSTFGLPDLEVVDVPPNLNALYRLVNAVAQQLVDGVARPGPDREQPLGVLEIDNQVVVTSRDIAAASGQEVITPDRLRSTTVGLHLESAGGRQQTMIEIRPPSGFAGRPGTWSHAALAELLGTEETFRLVRPGDDAMQAAHRRAVAELATVKARFLKGLHPGETLYIKHSFETDAGTKWFAWVAVVRWSGEQLDGQLASDPASKPITGLELGQRLVIKEQEIFDWMIEMGSGGYEGGYTNRVALDQGE